MRAWGGIYLAFVFGAIGSPLHAWAEDLTSLSLEDLFATEVTSVAKKPQKVESAAAAIFVISQEDIRRSGATTVPDLLRMVPGLEVADLPANGSAVSARGFNGRFSNKLLILVDGRAIYTSTLAGVLWDQQLVAVEDIQRIEIVRGPGATLWGANAVNGVINVVTKHAVDTLGAAATVQLDDGHGRRFHARLGTQLGESGALRVYATGNSNNDHALGPVELDDRSKAIQAGFRYDMEPSDRDAFTLQGDVQSGDFNLRDSLWKAPVSDGGFNGANVLGRWTRTLGQGAGLSVQLYWDRVRRDEFGLSGSRDLFDFDASHHFRSGERNAIVWGFGYRETSDRVEGQPNLLLTPMHRSDAWYSAYGQDDIQVIPERLTLTIGAKLEHNDYSGFEFQPSVRAIWLSPGGWSVWGAVSQAVRTPSRLETGLTVATPQFMISPTDVGSEKMTAYELGWRGHISPSIALDLTAFRQNYDSLIALSYTGYTPGLPPIFRFANQGSGANTGAEAALDAKLNAKWTVKVAASVQDLTVDAGGFQPVSYGNPLSAGASPRGQLSVRSWWNVTDNVDLDVWLRHVDQLRAGPVDAYTDLDVRIAWRPTVHLELSVTGKNLLDKSRIEIIDPGVGIPAVVDRRFMFSVAARY